MSQRVGKIKCPRCKKVWIIPWGEPGIECNCHLICPDGETPADCTVTPYTYTLGVKYPAGMHTDAENEGDKKINASGYCSTHNKYVYRDRLFLEMDWQQFERTRLPKNLRMMKQ